MSKLVQDYMKHNSAKGYNPNTRRVYKSKLEPDNKACKTLDPETHATPRGEDTFQIYYTTGIVQFICEFDTLLTSAHDTRLLLYAE